MIEPINVPSSDIRGFPYPGYIFLLLYIAMRLVYAFGVDSMVVGGPGLRWNPS